MCLYSLSSFHILPPFPLFLPLLSPSFSSLPPSLFLLPLAPHSTTARAHTCDKKVIASDLSFFELWASSFATGAVLIAYTLCLWLSCMAYCVCCKRKRDLCIGVVIGCGIISTFFFIILAGFNANAVGLVVDTPTNSTLHNEDCFSPYWLAYIPPFAFGAVVLAFIFSLFCCLCCKLTFHVCCSDVHRYARL